MPVFSSHELWFLFRLHAPVVIVGFPDPTLGFLTEEIEQLTLQAQDALVNKKILKQDIKKRWVICEPLGGWIRMIAGAQHTVLTMRHDAGGVETTRSYYFDHDEIIALQHQATGEYVIEPVNKNREIYDFLLEPLLTLVYCMKNEAPHIITEKVLTRAREQIEKKRISQAKAILRSSFPVEDQLHRFIQDLASPITRLSLVAFHHGEQAGGTGGFSVIAGEQDIWLFMPHNNELSLVQVKNISREDLENSITNFLPRAEAAP